MHRRTIQVPTNGQSERIQIACAALPATTAAGMKIR